MQKFIRNLMQSTCVLALLAAPIEAAHATGSNTTSANAAPETPAAYTPSTTQTGSLGSAICGEQLTQYSQSLDSEAYGLSVSSNVSEGVGVGLGAAATAAHLVADILGVALEATEVVFANPAPAAAFAAAMVGDAFDIAGVVNSGVGLGISIAQTVN